jgi:predicted nucleic acid-binding protein
LLIIDANIAVKLVIDEPGRSEAMQRLRSEATLAAPDWIRAELAHVFWKKSRSRHFEAQMAASYLDSIGDFLDHYVPAAELMPTALGLAFELDHWVYDCIYLACALQAGSKLLTADRKFWSAAKRGGYEDVVELLTWKEQSA